MARAALPGRQGQEGPAGGGREDRTAGLQTRRRAPPPRAQTTHPSREGAPAANRRSRLGD